MQRAPLFVIAVLFAPCAAAEELVQAPKFHVGDRWRFMLIDKDTGKTTRWSREIVEIMPNGHLKVRFGNGTISEYDAAMNFIAADGKPRIFAQYPMKIGDAWSVSGPSHRVGAWAADENIRGRVAATDTIDGPAGPLDCMRVEADVGYGVKAYSKQELHVRWYCPAIKWIAKETTEEREFNPYQTGYSRRFTESQLVEFIAGD